MREDLNSHKLAKKPCSVLKIRELCEMMISDKKGLEHLSLLLIAKNIKHIVFSPGSRNAPLIATFPRYKEFSCYSIVDERSAAFFALGIAQKTGETVVLSCTSGSALLNYAPAMAEAYYQNIPLLVISADRPEKLIDCGDGQTIRQENIYQNYIKKSFQLAENPSTEKELIDFQQNVLEAIETTQFPDKGPVHINIPFAEPIYGETNAQNPEIIPIKELAFQADLPENEIEKFAKQMNASKKIMILVGQQKPNKQLGILLAKLAEFPSVIILSETTSNVSDKRFINCIDKTLASITNTEQEYFMPDLLISINGNIISKKIKSFLRAEKPYDHWHIDFANRKMDTYFHLSTTIACRAEDFLNKIISSIQTIDSDFREKWLEKKHQTETIHSDFLKNAPYSDLVVFEKILNALPPHSSVHFANSTPIRYSQLFDLNPTICVDSNRGTSGIDGSISTAVGAAFVSSNFTTVVSGDLSFFYDSNALWNHYISPLLRIIVINNQGGGIFRFIEGPSKLPELDTFFETKHERKAKSLAEEAELEYLSAGSIEELEEHLKFFFDHSGKAKLLELFTPNERNAEVLKVFFKAMAKR